jgi:septal ring factor EnvC (AmiA/AmiB activator)
MANPYQALTHDPQAGYAADNNRRLQSVEQQLGAMSAELTTFRLEMMKVVNQLERGLTESITQREAALRRELSELKLDTNERINRIETRHMAEQAKTANAKLAAVLSAILSVGLAVGSHFLKMS